MPKFQKQAVSLALAGVTVLWSCTFEAAPARAWGNEGHETVVLIAQSLLTPGTLREVRAMLAADADTRTAHDIADEATWADVEKNSQDAQWHYVDVELESPDLKQACFDMPASPFGAASRGPAQDCVVDKINEFAAELADANVSAEERLLALKFLLHLVGDIHQPLHASDDHDRGGNNKRVSAPGFRSGNLHHFWDTEWVRKLGPSPKTVAADLVKNISQQQVQAWSSGTAVDWAMESFELARQDAYGRLPEPNAHHHYRLGSDYVSMAEQDVAEQLSKAGVRLAMVLNEALGHQ